VDDICIRLDTIPKRDWQTDGQSWYSSIALCILCMLTLLTDARDKNPVS